MSNFFNVLTSVFSAPPSPTNPKHMALNPSPLSSVEPSTASTVSTAATADIASSPFSSVTRQHAATASQLLSACDTLASVINQKRVTVEHYTQLLSLLDTMLSLTLTNSLAGGTSTIRHHLLTARKHVVAKANHVALQHIELLREFITSTGLGTVGRVFPGTGMECLAHLHKRLLELRDMLMRPLVGVGYKRRMVNALRHDERYAIAFRWVVEGDKGERVWDELKRYVVRLEECIVEEHWIAVEESVEELVEWTEWWMLRAMQKAKTSADASSIRRRSIAATSASV